MPDPRAYDVSVIGARTPLLLVVLGTDADPKPRTQGGYHVGGSSDVHKLLPAGLAFDQTNLSKQFLKTQGQIDPGRYACVLNLVTDPDQHPRTLERVRKLLRGYRGRVINRPEAVLKTTRDQVAKRLTGIEDLRVPKAVRLHNPKPGAASAAAERAGVAFPLIVRLAGTHTGKIVGVVDGPPALDAACVGPGQFILTEYVDFQSQDGLYRKYRMWSFGRTPIFRHMIVSEDWNVHVSHRQGLMAHRPELISEEMRLLERSDGAFPPPVHQVFAAVQGRIGLDFFGMDFGIDRQGQVVLFEANATMSFFPLERPPHFMYLGKIREPAQLAFRHMLFPKI